MIESKYWKEELQRIEKCLRRVSNPPRWTERLVCITERDIMGGFFIVRRLVELYKTSSKTREFKFTAHWCNRTDSKLTKINDWDLEWHYNLEKEVSVSKDIQYISNQFIHASISYVVRDESRNWSDVYLVSDFDRNNQIWRVSVSEIQQLFQTASDDYPSEYRMIYDEEKGDYKISTD